jgi:CubicO group peptidase (beta-lactamase class C family)
MRAAATVATAWVLCAVAGAAPPARPDGAYFPLRHPEWEHRRPAEVGMNPAKLGEAVAFAIASETKAPRDLALNHRLSYTREPENAPIGPFKERGDPSGLVIRKGYVVAEWGDPARVDMTFSVTKSFLSTVVGLALDRGLIRDVNDRVQPYVPLAEFDSAHNRTITWDHLLRQTSDWEGTLWGKPDWADRPQGDPATWLNRPRNEPGAVYEYNDVRVNVLALAALHVWRRPLPQVLREEVMDPIGASPTWRWHGYDNSWVNVDGVMVQSVSGGGHWGGGMWISTYDQARFGLLTLRRGRWRDRQILSDRWVAMATTPTSAEPGYGFMNWFLNTGRKRLPSAPEKTFFHLGAGANVVYVDPEHDLVVVARWIEDKAFDGIAQRVLAAIDTERSR